DEVTMGIDSFLEHHERIFRSVPVLTLHLSRQGPVGVAVVGQLLKVRSLGRLRELTLDLSGLQLGDARAEALAFSPLMRPLIHLHLTACGIGEDGLTALATSTNFPKLRRLILGGTPFGSSGAAAFADSLTLPAGLELQLGEASLSREVGKRL